MVFLNGDLMGKRISEGVHWVKVLGHWTRYSTAEFFGATDSEKSFLNEAENRKTTIVMIPGNPGNDLFYKEFALIIVEQLAKSFPNNDIRLFTIAHLNHVPILSELASETHVRFSLNDQIDQKLNFCLEYLKNRKNDQIYFIGHSIGSLMCLNIVQKLKAEKWNIKNCFALFPALEQMKETPNGYRINPIIQTFEKYDLLTKLLTIWFQFIPRFVKQWLCNLNLATSSSNSEQIPKCVKDAAIELFNTDVIRNIIYMTKTEFDTVKEFNESLLNDFTFFYYGVEDGWSPLKFAEVMRKRVPNECQVIIDEMNCEHAFVIHDTKKMALKIAEWIISNNKYNKI